jgi:hypothetical protein
MKLEWEISTVGCGEIMYEKMPKMCGRETFYGVSKRKM